MDSRKGRMLVGPVVAIVDRSRRERIGKQGCRAERCPECGQPVMVDAGVCPYCKRTLPAPWRLVLGNRLSWLGARAFQVIALGYLVWLGVSLWPTMREDPTQFFRVVMMLPFMVIMLPWWKYSYGAGSGWLLLPYVILPATALLYGVGIALLDPTTHVRTLFTVIRTRGFWYVVGVFAVGLLCTALRF